MNNISHIIETMKKWKSEGTHKKELAELRNMGGDSLRVLAKQGAHLGKGWVEAWQVTGHLISLGIKDKPKRGAKCFYSSGVREDRMKQILGSKSISDSVRRASGMLKEVDLTDVFWSAVKWNDPLKRKEVQASWWESYFGGDDVPDKKED